MTRRTLLKLAASTAFAAERKNRAPISHEALTVKVPEAAPVKLSNGVTVLAIEDSRLPLVFVSFRVEGAGDLYSSRTGVARMTADQLAQGAGSRSAQQIVEESARLGASFSTFAGIGGELANVDGSGLSSRFDQWMTLLTDVLLHPTFPADEFNGGRQREMALHLNRARPANIAFDAFVTLVYGPGHGGSRNVPPEALASLTPEMLVAWHRERYAPASTVLSVIGRVNPAAVVARAESLLSGWKTPQPNFSLPPTPPPAAQRKLVLIDRPGLAQTEIMIGGLLFERRDPDYFAMQALDTILGNGNSSRLYQILVDQKGYAVEARSSFQTYRFPGFWQARATVRADATADSIAIILAQLRRLCDEPIPAAELNDAKAFLVGQFALDLEQPSQVIGYSYERYRYGFSANYWERTPAMVGSTTAAELQTVAQKYLNPDRAQIVVLGDGARVQKSLAKFAT